MTNTEFKLYDTPEAILDAASIILNSKIIHDTSRSALWIGLVELRRGVIPGTKIVCCFDNKKLVGVSFICNVNQLYSGFTPAVLQKNFPNKKHVMMLVLPEYRKQGIAKKMFSMSEGYSKAQVDEYIAGQGSGVGWKQLWKSLNIGIYNLNDYDSHLNLKKKSIKESFFEKISGL